MLPIELWYKIMDYSNEKTIASLLQVSKKLFHIVRYYIMDNDLIKYVMGYDLVLLKKYWDRRNTCAIISNGCSIEVLEWLKKDGYLDNYCLMGSAIAGGEIEVIKWLLKRGYKFNEDSLFMAVNTTMHRGNMNVIKWLVENGCPLNSRGFSWAAYWGHLDLMKWLLENGCPMDKEAFQYAAEYGSLKNMMWLLEKKCPWDEWTFVRAADNGSLKNMKWLLENGCPWEEHTFHHALDNGSLENIKWLLDNGCPYWEQDMEAYELFKERKVLERMIKDGDLEKVKKMYQESEISKYIFMRHAVKYEKLEIIQWLLENDCRYSSITKKKLVKLGVLVD